VTRFPVIIGPTAGGKTALAVEVALAFERRGLGRGEVVSADAFAIYRGMDIGTAKPAEAERRGVRHHLIDIVEPDDPEPFTVHRWLALANEAIEDIRQRAVPIVVGGTHLYVKVLLEGMFSGPGADERVRAELEAMDPGARRAELERVDPGAAERIHPNDARRTVRALEVHRLTGRPISAWQGQWDQNARSDCLLVALEWEAEELNRRINARVRNMIGSGLTEETERLASSGRLGPQAAQALGYKQSLAGLRGECSIEEAIEQIKIETRRFAKNQRTWMRRLRTHPGAMWIPMPIDDDVRIAQTIITQCFTTTDEDAADQSASTND